MSEVNPLCEKKRFEFFPDHQIFVGVLNLVSKSVFYFFADSAEPSIFYIHRLKKTSNTVSIEVESSITSSRFRVQGSTSEARFQVQPRQSVSRYHEAAAAKHKSGFGTLNFEPGTLNGAEGRGCVHPRPWSRGARRNDMPFFSNSA
jgi:hypothetical protein